MVISDFFCIFAKNYKVMGRLIILLLFLIVFLLCILVVSKIIPLSGREKSYNNGRKSFDRDIDEVAKRVKMNQ